jgi:hypothetical protein
MGSLPHEKKKKIEAFWPLGVVRPPPLRAKTLELFIIIYFSIFYFLPKGGRITPTWSFVYQNISIINNHSQ